ncbi:hypothetical protein [Piscirickettsia salmonis]|uniref:hypothetical protein n=1 Tax=Piscirickettsia salmonis TaxID=1238 RepID=UPI0007C94695|nr:hypothetical protein A0O36_02158 [Piscirickettsiaceae bacterium NZ-RLO1]
MPKLTDPGLTNPLQHAAGNFLTPQGQRQLLRVNSSMREVMNSRVRRQAVENLESSFSGEIDKLMGAIEQLGLVEVELVDSNLRKYIESLTAFASKLDQDRHNGDDVFQKSIKLEKLRKLVNLVQVLGEGDKAKAKQAIAQYANETRAEAAMETDSPIKALTLGLQNLTHPVTKLAITLLGLAQAIFIGGEYLTCEDSSALADCFEESQNFAKYAVVGAGAAYAGMMIFANQFSRSGQYTKPAEDLTADEQLSRSAGRFASSLG